MFTPVKSFRKAKDANSAKPTESSETTTKLKKGKSFRRIRGLLTGESRRKKKAEKLAAANAALEQNKEPTVQKSLNTSEEEGDDESTIFGVQVDENASVGTGISRTSQKSFLETNGATNLLPSLSSDSADGVDGKKSYILKVVLLLMDPKSRRFELLQLEFDSLKALVADVLAQIPISVTEAALREQTYVGICGVDVNEMTSEKLLADFCVGNEVLVAMPRDVTAKECVHLARPILSDDKVISMLKSSGIDATAWKSLKKSKKKSDADTTDKSLPEVSHDLVEQSGSSRDPTNIQESSNGVSTEGNDSSSGSRSFIMTIFGVIVLSVLLQVFHLYISTPIAPGSVVPPRVWLNKCGLLRYTSSCEDSLLHVGKNGTVTGFDSENKIAWEIEGGICNANDTACVPGMQFTKDLKLIVGGKPIVYVNKIKVDTPLSPWPFEKEPKVKTWLKKSKK